MDRFAKPEDFGASGFPVTPFCTILKVYAVYIEFDRFHLLIQERTECNFFSLTGRYEFIGIEAFLGENGGGDIVTVNIVWYGIELDGCNVFAGNISDGYAEVGMIEKPVTLQVSGSSDTAVSGKFSGKGWCSRYRLLLSGLSILWHRSGCIFGGRVISACQTTEDTAYDSYTEEYQQDSNKYSAASGFLRMRHKNRFTDGSHNRISAVETAAVIIWNFFSAFRTEHGRK